MSGLFEKDLASNCSGCGFHADSSFNLTWHGCSSTSNTKGMSLVGSRLCSVNNCSVKGCKEEGIVLTNSHKCALQGNDAFSNEIGISLVGSNACLLSENNGSLNKIDGISIMQLSSTDVVKNKALENGQGIFVQSSDNMKIDGNTLGHNSRYGLRMSQAKKCNITENTLIRNQIAGVNLVDCKGNFIYHNSFIENGLQNAADNGANQWDAGPKIGGNYWSDHAVSGNPGESARKIPSSGVDSYPFQNPEGWR
jgi:parallel beta-helix repeat protein